MILASIYYRLFPGEAESLDVDAARDWHHIEGELHMEFTDSPARFVSWGGGTEPGAVQVRAEPFFEEQMLASVEMSDHPYWCELIGHELKLNYADRERQVLRVGSPGGEVFLSSQSEDGSFQGDSLRISRLSPK